MLLCSAGLMPLLVSAVGKDAAGDLLLSHWRQLGASTQAIHVLPGLRTPSVSTVFDAGERTAACDLHVETDLSGPSDPT